MRVLVTGAQGLLAAAVVREFGTLGEVRAYDRRELDIRDAGRARAVIAAERPDAIINCAAYNSVDAAETDAVSALALNALAVRALADAAAAVGAAFVHYGTDFVFDGEASRPYTEDDSPNPRSVYGASKLLGEWFALQAPRGYVLRVESLFGEPGPAGSRAGSLGTIVRQIQGSECAPVFVDRTITPAYTKDVAWATRQLLVRDASPGIYHCVNSGATTWAEVAAELARLLGRPLLMEPITLEALALPARRPRYSALSNAKLAAAGIQMPTWRDALARYLRGA